MAMAIATAMATDKRLQERPARQLPSVVRVPVNLSLCRAVSMLQGRPSRRPTDKTISKDMAL